jgi:hypothetical protein
MRRGRGSACGECPPDGRRICGPAALPVSADAGGFGAPWWQWEWEWPSMAVARLAWCGWSVSGVSAISWF